METSKAFHTRSPFQLILFAFLIFTVLECSKEDPLPDTEIPGVIYLGRGYDVFEAYAEASSIREPMIELGGEYEAITALGRDFKIPTEIDYLPYVFGDVLSYYGSSAKIFQRSLSVKAGLSGSYLGFSGSVETGFQSGHYERAMRIKILPSQI